MATKKSHFTKAAPKVPKILADALAPVAPTVKVTPASVAAVEDYSALNVPPDVLAAAGLRNGMAPEAIHEAIKAVMVARALA